MSSGHQRITWRRNIAENFNRLSRVHERNRQTDRQTDGRRHIANMNMGSRSLNTIWWSVLCADPTGLCLQRSSWWGGGWLLHSRSRPFWPRFTPPKLKSWILPSVWSWEQMPHVQKLMDTEMKFLLVTMISIIPLLETFLNFLRFDKYSCNFKAKD